MLHDLLLTCPNDFFVGLVRYLFDWSVGTKKQSDDKKLKRDGGQIEKRDWTKHITLIKQA